jgi:hypothetical protein
MTVPADSPAILEPPHEPEGKLAATWLASFIMNGATGIGTIIYMVTNKTSITEYPTIDFIIYTTTLINVLFFYYIEAFEEIDFAEQRRIGSVSILEWYLRVVNQLLLSILWVLLGIRLSLFLGGILLFYCILLLWDFTVMHPQLVRGDRSSVPKVVRFDIIGLLLTIPFVFGILVERIAHGDTFNIIPNGLTMLIQNAQPGLVHTIVMMITGGTMVGYIIILFSIRKTMNNFRLRHILVSRERLA